MLTLGLEDLEDLSTSFNSFSLIHFGQVGDGFLVRLQARAVGMWSYPWVPMLQARRVWLRNHEEPVKFCDSHNRMA